eukprot:GHVU01165387.1.p1 GENE.GHVU01165387.1~~GHVU01165387.1.p1  ORF type:complete len:409 (-),score=26.42 GHVU01165387.1:8-1234(-)
MYRDSLQHMSFVCLATVIQQDTCDPPEALGISFSADVIRRERQMIFVLRENVTSFTAACLIEDERSDTLRAVIIQLCIELRPLDGPTAVVRTDPAPGFAALANDKQLHLQRINIELGRIKNRNENPVAERAVQEVEQELLRQDPSARVALVTPLTLSIAIARLNSRVRRQGLSSREIWTQRDQFTNEQLPIVDRNIILDQHNKRMKNHPYSEKAKAPQGQIAHSATVDVGDLVYLHSDGSKLRARDRYLVVSTEGQWCYIRKFTGAQLRNTSYRVKLSECYKVPIDPALQAYKQSLNYEDESDCEEDAPAPIAQPPTPEPITQELSETEQYDALHQQYGETISTELAEISCSSELSEINSHQQETAPVITPHVGEDYTLPELGFRKSSRVRRSPIRYGYDSTYQPVML